MPVRLTDCGEFDAESENFNVSDLVPELVGLKTTEVVHELPALRVPAHEFELIENCVPVASVTELIDCVEANAGFESVIVTEPLE